MNKSLILSASSTNIQPWHFIVANSQEGKERIAKSVQGDYKANLAKVMNASHVVVFCSKTDVTEEHLLKVLDKEDLFTNLSRFCLARQSQRITLDHFNNHYADIVSKLPLPGSNILRIHTSVSAVSRQKKNNIMKIKHL